VASRSDSNLGRLALFGITKVLLPRLPALIEESRLRVLPFKFSLALTAGSLDHQHRHPIDWFLAGRATVENLVLLTFLTYESVMSCLTG